MDRPDSDHLTIAEACVLGKFSYKTLYRLAAKGKLTLLRRPGDRRTWVSRREVESILTPVPTKAATA